MASPDSRPSPPAAPLPWNRTWRDLVAGRANGAPMLTPGSAPPPAPMLRAGPGPPAAPMLAAGPTPPPTLSPFAGPSPQPAPPALLPGPTVDLHLASCPERARCLLLPAGVTPTTGTGTASALPSGTTPAVTDAPSPAEPGAAPALPAGEGDPDTADKNRSLWVPPSR